MARSSSAGAVALAGVPRVNLMPRAELDRRERTTAVRRWGWGVVGALAVVVLVAAGAYGLNWAAQQQLASEQARTNALIGQLAGLSDVSTALTARKDLEGFRGQAMAADLGWSKTLASLAAALPAGVAVTGFDLVTGGVPVKGADAKTQQGLVGTITLESANPVEIVQVIRGFRRVSGVTAADGTQLTSSDDTGAGGVYTYQLTIDFDQTLYSGAYAQDGAK